MARPLNLPSVNPDVHPAIIREVIDYNPDTGVMVWRSRSPRLFSASGTGGAVGAANRWNSVFAGKRCFKTDSQRGYLRGVLFDKPYYAHRIAWAHHHGSWPVNYIDHLNGVQSDNRIENLRDVSAQENSRNQKLHCRNTSGFFGVSWKSKRNVWEASIGKKYLGTFRNKADAISARKSAEQELKFHGNHGRTTQNG